MGRLPAKYTLGGIIFAIGASFAACSTDREVIVSAVEGGDVQPWRLPKAAGALYSASCPSDQTYIAPEEIELGSLNVPSNENSKFAELSGVELDGVSFVAGYHLTSDDPRFGGLSGLAAPKWGELVAVTDQGEFVWIGLDETTASAPLTAAMATMRGASGEPLGSGKKDQDAEGLAIRDGLAIVSFERRHRVEAFDLNSCGAAARAAPIMSLSEAVYMPRVKENGGLEALALSPEGGLILGLETPKDDAAPLSMSPSTGVADFSILLEQPEDHRMTGADFVQTSFEQGTLFSLHRAYSPIRGARIALQSSEADKTEDMGWSLSAPKTLVTLAMPGPVDNFEGVAAIANPEGGIRLYIVSDNNFSPTQRTLLYIFDVES